MTKPQDRRPAPAQRPASGRDALKQSVEPTGAPPTQERSYEDGQDAAFDPSGDRAKDKPGEERR